MPLRSVSTLVPREPTDGSDNKSRDGTGGTVGRLECYEIGRVVEHGRERRHRVVGRFSSASHGLVLVPEGEAGQLIIADRSQGRVHRLGTCAGARSVTALVAQEDVTADRGRHAGTDAVVGRDTRGGD